MASRRTLRKHLDSALRSLGEAKAHVEAAQRLHAEAAPRLADTAGDVAALDQDLAQLETDRDSLESEVRRLGQVQHKRAEDFARQAAAAVNRQRGLLDRLAASAAAAAPGWLGRLWPPEGGPPILDGVAETPVDGLVRIGSLAAVPGHQAAPMLVPFLGRGHLQLDADGPSEPAVALLRGIVLRVLASARPGDVRLLAADPAHVGGTFADFQALVRAGVQEPTATGVGEFRDLLDWAERHVKEVQDEVKAAGKATLADLRAADPKVTTPYVVLAVASFGSQTTPEDAARLATLSRVGVQYGLNIVCVGYPGQLEHAQQLVVSHDSVLVAAIGRETPVAADEAPDGGTVSNLCRQIARSTEAETARRRPTFATLIADEIWTESSVEELRTTIGFEGSRPFSVAFNDATPHWFIGGRSGSGKTVFLLDVLYPLAAKYGPDELAMYLLDFKEGVSFNEFVPTPADDTWLPHAKAVGIESDREYGLAILDHLCGEMVRRANLMKRSGVSKLSDLRQVDPTTKVPRIVAVIDEFQVLLQGEDAVSKRAVDRLEEIARKGRSYGIHLALASQSIRSIRALWTRSESIFGQFPLRIALPGAKGILGRMNEAASRISLGQVIINPQAGIPEANHIVAFPNAQEDPSVSARLRRKLCAEVDSPPPVVFRGFEEPVVFDDEKYRGLRPSRQMPVALVGRRLDVNVSTATVDLDASPGRHFAALGSSPSGAGMLQAAAVSLGRQCEAGTAAFYVGSYVASASPVAEATTAALKEMGHTIVDVEPDEIRRLFADLADFASRKSDRRPGDDCAKAFLVLFGVDAVSGYLQEFDGGRRTAGRDDIINILRLGPGRSVHVLGWWRAMRRFIDDLGTSSNREYVATVAMLNVDCRPLFGVGHEWNPRENRAMLVDQNTNKWSVIVPFSSPEHDRLMAES